MDPMNRTKTITLTVKLEPNEIRSYIRFLEKCLAISFEEIKENKEYIRECDEECERRRTEARANLGV